MDTPVIEFVQRAFGYTLTGDTRERIMLILWGSGKNGKSTLVELFTDLLGDYATGTDVETILAKKYSGVGNEVAALKGARFVPTSEVEKGRRLAESKVKQLTCRDTVTARFLFSELFSFRPEFKLWLSTNNKPEIAGTDDAIWDRIRLVPFTRRFVGTNQDASLPAKLRDEMDGILAWAVRGCLSWQKSGLGEPETVIKATESYRTEMDTLAAFIGDRCVLHPKAEVPATALHQEYQKWCAENGEEVQKQRKFGAQLSERGYESFKYTSGPQKDRKGWRGIGLRADEPDPDGGNDSGEDGPNGGSNGPLNGQTADDRPLGEFPIDMGNSTDGEEEADDSGRKIQQNRLVQPRVREDLEKRSALSALSAEQQNSQNKTGEEVDDSRPKNQNPGPVHPPVEEVSEKRSPLSTDPVPPDTYTPDERLEKAMSACRSVGTGPAAVAGLVLQYNQPLQALAGALASHHEEPELWQKWLNPALKVIEALEAHTRSEAS